MKREYLEITVGLFVMIGIFCIGYMSIRLGKLDIFSSREYVLKARFTSVSGLKKGARVEISGIPVGKVGDYYLDPKTEVAMVEMMIKKDIKIDTDVIASIKTSGIIGDKYIKLTLGGADQHLKDGDMITDTESGVDIEELISKFVFGKV
ncbi:MAG: outer membrane lipid asymmetry maintenance protein MlaD [Candidatus Aureabacteria bacterium]|nr:outer membrane lipid asymmetry maintenance protein MlaD [Candidatus Auribacterota bacterium]